MALNNEKTRNSTDRIAGPASRPPGRPSLMAGWMTREHPDWLRTDYWLEWRDRCALGLCAPATQRALHAFAGFQYGRLVDRYAQRTNAPKTPGRLSQSEAWHLFETHLTLRGTREGKCYKDWLFARNPAEPEERVKAWAGGAALLMRDVVRNFLAREFAPAWMISLHTPLSAGEGLTVEDLLADTLAPHETVAQREFERLAQEAARVLFAAMGRREKAVFLARQIGVSLAHPAVEQAAGCRKSQAFAAFTRFARKAVEELQREYAGEDREGLRLLTLLTFEALDSLIRGWATTHEECGELLALEKTT